MISTITSSVFDDISIRSPLQSLQKNLTVQNISDRRSTSSSISAVTSQIDMKCDIYSQIISFTYKYVPINAWKIIERAKCLVYPIDSMQNIFYSTLISRYSLSFQLRSIHIFAITNLVNNLHSNIASYALWVNICNSFLQIQSAPLAYFYWHGYCKRHVEAMMWGEWN